jgi:hypothetical protein
MSLAAPRGESEFTHLLGELRIWFPTIKEV